MSSLFFKPTDFIKLAEKLELKNKDTTQDFVYLISRYVNLKLQEKIEDSRVFWVKPPTDFHPQHFTNGMVSVHETEGWTKVVEIRHEEK